MEAIGRPLLESEAIPIMVHVLDGLSHAHSKDIVHRDLKPQNILLKQEQKGVRAKISDFGLSKNFTQAGFSGMTITGTYAGSYPFMPREQVTNFKYVKPVSDIWSLAATFYFLLTGQLPRDMREGDDPLEAILTGVIIPIRARRPDLSKDLAQIIDKALLNNPVNRFQDASSMRKAIIKLL